MSGSADLLVAFGKRIALGGTGPDFPDVSAGFGVPTEVAATGSIYFRQDAPDQFSLVYVRQGGAWVPIGGGFQEFGGLYITGGVIVQTVNIAFAPLTDWTANSASSGGVVPDFMNDRITVGNAGIYLALLSISGNFPSARTLFLHVMINGAVAPMGGIRRGATGGIVTSAGGSTNGIIAIPAGAVVDVEASTDVDGQALTLLECAFSLIRIG